MSIRKSHRSSRGSAFVWTIVWLGGMAVIAWATLNFAVPRFEQKLQTTVKNAVSSINDSPIVVAVKGQHVTLSGQLDTEDKRQNVINAAQSSWGVISIHDELSSTQLLASNGDSLTPIAQVKTNGSENASSAEPTGNTADAEQSEEQDEESVDTGSELAALDPEDDSLEMPSIDISIEGEILVVEGVLAATDDPSKVIQTAMTIFNLDIVSNGIQEQDGISKSEWMASIEKLLPAMSELSNPKISVMERQITISGVAPNSTAHDMIIGTALSSLGEFALVERISIEKSTNETSEVDQIDAEVENVEEEQLATDAKAAEDERIAAEAKAAEEERIAAEAKAAEDERIAAKAKAAEEERIAAEAKAAEEERIAAKAKAAEEERIAAEAKAAEDERIAAEAKAAEDERIAAEAKAAEEERIAAEAKAAEEERVAAEAKAAEDERIAAEAKAAEDERIAAEAKAAEDERIAAEAKAVEDERIAAEAKAAEEERIAAEAKAAEEERIAAEAKAAEEERIAAEAKAAEEERLATEARAAEEIQLAAEAKATEDERLAAEANKPALAAQEERDKLRAGLAALPSLRILFEINSNVFTTESLGTLDEIAKVLTQFPDSKVSIEGHTDATGTSAANLELSLLRATTVRDYLISKGVSVYNLRAMGFGEELPIASNRTAKGRATNRRIDFTF